ncbi:MAG: YihY/virulence factor BrkB family protein [Actinobacteria bacterium]|nr:MAG: YihY/virulence factor BrkB family protein [Actinomycetota bacterium]
MKLRQRTRREEGRPPPDEAPLEDAPQPQPEHHEPRLRDPEPTDLSKRDYVAILKRALKQANADHITNLAAALAYYAFLAIPSALLIAAGVFSLLAGPHAVTTIVDKLGTIVPSQAQSLLKGSLQNMTKRQATGITVAGIGGALALWSLGGAMQNLMWALDIAYDREETRGFVRRRLAAFGMVFFALLGFGLAFGVLVLGPHLSTWIGSAVGAKTVVQIVWWVAEWPLLVGGLLVSFAGILYLGPNVDHPRWRFLSFGAVLAVVIWLLASGAFAFYVSRFGSYNKAWGTLSAVVVMLTWLWLSGVALLLGAEVNAEAERSRELRQGRPAEVELQAPAKA